MNLPFILVKGAGEMASACAHRLWRAGFPLVMTELALPTCVRRKVSFAQAMLDGTWTVEGVVARRAAAFDPAWRTVRPGQVPVLAADGIAPAGIAPAIIVDARIAKRNLDNTPGDAPLVIGLGPGLHAGRDVHVVVETMRGHHLGRILESGYAEPDTGIPGALGGVTFERVLRAPCDGIFRARLALGDRVAPGGTVGEVAGRPVKAVCGGLLRGLIADGVEVTENLKVGDVDPRNDETALVTISDKARTISGAVLELACAYAFGKRDRG